MAVTGPDPSVSQGSTLSKEEAQTEGPEAPPAELPPFPCTNCGAPVLDAEPQGDWVCGECGEIHLHKAG